MKRAQFALALTLSALSGAGCQPAAPVHEGTHLALAPLADNLAAALAAEGPAVPDSVYIASARLICGVYVIGGGGKC